MIKFTIIKSTEKSCPAGFAIKLLAARVADWVAVATEVLEEKDLEAPPPPVPLPAPP